MTETNENRELKTQLQHIADGGYRCPRCNSDELDGGERDSIDDYEYRDIECLNCGFRYTEEYILNGYWLKGDDDPQIGPTLVEHLRQQLRWARKTIAKLREDKERQELRMTNVRCRSRMPPVGSTPLLKVRHKRWDWGKQRTIYALMAQGHTAEEAVAMEKAAPKDGEGAYSTIQHDQILDPLWNALKEKAAPKDEEGGFSYKATTSNDEQGDEE